MKIFAALAVLLYFVGGVITGTTGDLVIGNADVSFLAALRAAIYGGVVLVVPVRYALRRVPDKTIALWGTAMSAAVLPLMMIALPAGYVVNGVIRLSMESAMLGAVQSMFSGRTAPLIFGLASAGSNTLFKPVVEKLVEEGLWRAGLAFTVAIVAASALFLWPIEAEPKTAERTVCPRAGAEEASFGAGATAFVLNQVVFGLMSLALFSLAELTLGERTGAATLDALRQASMLVGRWLRLRLPQQARVPVQPANPADHAGRRTPPGAPRRKDAG